VKTVSSPARAVGPPGTCDRTSASWFATGAPWSDCDSAIAIGLIAADSAVRRSASPPGGGIAATWVLAIEGYAPRATGGAP
jgi:hypothetical protein